MIRVNALDFSYDKNQVLFDINVTLPSGEIAVVMGSSGGGKTTLVKCMAGLLPVKAGQISIDGTDLAKEPERARAKCGMVFQYAALFDYLNVSENVLFGVERKRRMSRAERADVLQGLLEAVGLQGTEKLLPDQLSGGMRKRVGLARALALEPSVLFFDEPTSGLDPVTAYSIDKLIVDTRDRTGATCVVVSHDVTSVLRVADRVLFLAGGELVFNGTTDEFRSTAVPEIIEIVKASKTESLARGSQ